MSDGREFNCGGVVEEEEEFPNGQSEDEEIASSFVQENFELLFGEGGLCLNPEGNGIYSAIIIDQESQEVEIVAPERRNSEEEIPLNDNQILVDCEGEREDYLFQVFRQRCEKVGLKNYLHCAEASTETSDFLSGAPSSLLLDLEDVVRESRTCRETAENKNDQSGFEKCSKEIGCNLARSVIEASPVGMINNGLNVFGGDIYKSFGVQEGGCMDGQQGNCIGQMMSGVIDNLWDTLKSLWQGVSWVATEGIPYLAEKAGEAFTRENLEALGDKISNLADDITAGVKRDLELARAGVDVVVSRVAQAKIRLDQAIDDLAQKGKKAVNYLGGFVGITPFNEDTVAIENRTTQRLMALQQLKEEEYQAQRRVYNDVKDRVDRIKAGANQMYENLKTGADFIGKMAKNFYHFIGESISQNYGCEKWVVGEKVEVPGPPDENGKPTMIEVAKPKLDENGETKSLMQMPKAAKDALEAAGVPVVCAKPFNMSCATCNQIMNNVCGTIGFVGAEVAIAFFTAGTVSAVKGGVSAGIKGAQAVTRALRATRMGIIATRRLRQLNRASGAGKLGRMFGKGIYKIGQKSIYVPAKTLQGLAKGAGKLAALPIVKQVVSKPLDKTVGSFLRLNERAETYAKGGVEALRVQMAQKSLAAATEGVENANIVMRTALDASRKTPNRGTREALATARNNYRDAQRKLKAVQKNVDTLNADRAANRIRQLQTSAAAVGGKNAAEAAQRELNNQISILEEIKTANRQGESFDHLSARLNPENQKWVSDNLTVRPRTTEVVTNFDEILPPSSTSKPIFGSFLSSANQKKLDRHYNELARIERSGYSETMKKNMSREVYTEINDEVGRYLRKNGIKYEIIEPVGSEGIPLIRIDGFETPSAKDSRFGKLIEALQKRADDSGVEFKAVFSPAQRGSGAASEVEKTFDFISEKKELNLYLGYDDLLNANKADPFAILRHEVRHLANEMDINRGIDRVVYGEVTGGGNLVRNRPNTELYSGYFSIDEVQAYDLTYRKAVQQNLDPDYIQDSAYNVLSIAENSRVANKEVQRVLSQVGGPDLKAGESLRYTKEGNITYAEVDFVMKNRTVNYKVPLVQSNGVTDPSNAQILGDLLKRQESFLDEKIAKYNKIVPSYIRPIHLDPNSGFGDGFRASASGSGHTGLTAESTVADMIDHSAAAKWQLRTVEDGIGLVNPKRSAERVALSIDSDNGKYFVLVEGRIHTPKGMKVVSEQIEIPNIRSPGPLAEQVRMGSKADIDEVRALLNQQFAPEAELADAIAPTINYIGDAKYAERAQDTFNTVPRENWRMAHDRTNRSVKFKNSSGGASERFEVSAKIENNDVFIRIQGERRVNGATEPFDVLIPDGATMNRGPISSALRDAKNSDEIKELKELILQKVYNDSPDASTVTRQVKKAGVRPGSNSGYRSVTAVDRGAMIQDARAFAQKSGWEKVKDSSKVQGRIMYAVGKGKKRRYYSLDMKTGTWEVCNAKGRWLEEVRLDLSPVPKETRSPQTHNCF
jgi:hypothetical protein